MKLLVLCSLLVFPAIGQDAAWENSPHGADLAAQSERLKPLLEQLHPDQWESKGAPPSYAAQFQSARRELAELAASAKFLDQQSSKLTAALDTYFRLQSLEWRIESLIDAVRKYESPAAGDQMLSVLRSNSGNREGLRAFIMDLAQRTEQEFTVVNKDAQACRTELSQIPAAARRNNTKK